MRKPKTPTLLGAMALGAALVVSSIGPSRAFGPPMRVGEEDAAVPAVDDPTPSSDLDNVAAEWGVSTDEAARQMALQDAMDTIDYAALDDGFAEIRSTPGENFRIHYYSAEPMNADLSRALTNAGISELTTFHSVPFTATELRVAHDTFRDLHPELKADSWLDAPSGQIVISVTELPNWARNEQAVGHVPVQWEVGQLSQPNIDGGHPLAPVCTAGFVVVHDGDNNRGISTAAHCDNGLTYFGYILNFKDARYADNYDVQWHDNPAITWSPRFYMGTETRTVLSRKLYSGMHVGDAACKYGRATQFTCGLIVNRDFCPGYVLSCNPNFVLVKRREDLDMSRVGDSGGPWFYNSRAFGIHSGGLPVSGSGIQGIFMPQEFVGTLDLEVLVAP